MSTNAEDSPPPPPARRRRAKRSGTGAGGMGSGGVSLERRFLRFFGSLRNVAICLAALLVATWIGSVVVVLRAGGLDPQRGSPLEGIGGGGHHLRSAAIGVGSVMKHSWLHAPGGIREVAPLVKMRHAFHGDKGGMHVPVGVHSDGGGAAVVDGGAEKETKKKKTKKRNDKEKHEAPADAATAEAEKAGAADVTAEEGKPIKNHKKHPSVKKGGEMEESHGKKASHEKGGKKKHTKKKKDEPEPMESPWPDVTKMDSPLLIFTCKRGDYLTRTLETVWEHHPVNKNLTAETRRHHRIIGSPIILSQDGDDETVHGIMSVYRAKFHSVGIPFYYIQHQPTVQIPSGLRADKRSALAYQELAQHYGWALRQAFSREAYRDDDVQHFAKGFVRSLRNHLPPDMEGRVTLADPDPPTPERVIVLEEDIQIAPDFFSYMNATATLLDDDLNLLAVSAFNDNGFEGRVSKRKRLLRSDFFPGLGWMMPRRVWDEIGDRWPMGWWDDWIREPEQRRDRHIIRPEISRTFHFGTKGGSSNNWLGDKLKKVKINAIDMKWEDEDLSYLKTITFDDRYWKDVNAAKIVSSNNAVADSINSDVRVQYNDIKQFAVLAKGFGLMDDEKAGVPRTAYKGIVEFRPHGRKGHTLYLTPPQDQLQKSFNKSTKR